MTAEPKPRSRATDDRLTKVITTDWFRAIAPKILPRAHRGMRRLSLGRFVPGVGLILWTTGAKSKKRRETPLEAVPLGDRGFLVVGSNFARDHHPAWTHNLLAQPRAEITVGGVTYAVEAELLVADDRDEAWNKALSHFAGWAAYRTITDREFRIFRLSPATSGP